MPTINCSVESCVYNKEKICEAEILQIGGKGANWTESLVVRLIEIVMTFTIM